MPRSSCMPLRDSAFVPLYLFSYLTHAGLPVKLMYRNLFPHRPRSRRPWEYQTLELPASRLDSSNSPGNGKYETS
ncbi:hypothetical protein GGR52DRAFT_522277 [Hypoxylon sp. FL1284]|nr:hypothetical protein GGR52DRAFT_522277 [Hypoxylon sp. FL1284]